MIQTLAARQGELVATLDLTRHARRYALRDNSNTIEVRVNSRSGKAYFARWVVVPDGSAGNPVLAARTQVPANVPLQTLDVSAEFDSGLVEPLTRSVTYARAVILRGFLRAGATRFRGARLRIERGAGVTTVDALGWVTGENTFELHAPLVEGVNRLALEFHDGLNWHEATTLEVTRQATSTPESFDGQRYAVIIGVSDYLHNEGGLNDLFWARRDAEGIHAFLTDPAGGGFEADNVRLLVDADATNQAVRTALFNFLTRARSDDLVIIYFAGHGSPDPNNLDNHYLLLHDTRHDNLGGTALPMWDLQNVLDFGIKSRRAVVFADACHSGGALRIPGTRSLTQLNFVNKYLEQLGREEGRMVITAARADEYSLEGPYWKGGVFTWSLLSGLRGKADINGDRIVTVGELVDHLSAEVPAETDDEQHPSFRSDTLNRSLPLALVVNTVAGQSAEP